MIFSGLAALDGIRTFSQTNESEFVGMAAGIEKLANQFDPTLLSKFTLAKLKGQTQRLSAGDERRSRQFPASPESATIRLL